jgi:lysophospholipase L1-like esterase
VTPNPLRWTSMLRDLYGRAPYVPAREDGFDAPLLEGYRAAMREVAAELGTPVVDAPEVWSAALAEKGGGKVEEFLLDGMHPNDAGHAAIAKALLPLIGDR